MGCLADFGQRLSDQAATATFQKGTAHCCRIEALRTPCQVLLTTDEVFAAILNGCNRRRSRLLLYLTVISIKLTKR
jgi:hypothetical protein